MPPKLTYCENCMHWHVLYGLCMVCGAGEIKLTKEAEFLDRLCELDVAFENVHAVYRAKGDFEKAADDFQSKLSGLIRELEEREYNNA